MDKVYQVFVSSTYSDLKDERRHVSETLAKAGYIPAGMELFPATDQQQLEYIKRIIGRSDYYVVIVGGKYGSLAEDGVSFTEKEYEYAIEKRIPVLAFLHANPDKIEVGKTDKDSDLLRKLDAFRNRLSGSRLVDKWTDRNDLCTKVVIAVGQSVNLAPSVGWVRGDQAIDPKLLQDFERLRSENEQLKQQLRGLNTFPRIKVTDPQGNPTYLRADQIVRVRCVITAPGEPKLGNSIVDLVSGMQVVRETQEEIIEQLERANKDTDKAAEALSSP
jgi:hypothetical protein